MTSSIPQKNEPTGLSLWQNLLAKTPLFEGFAAAELALLLGHARERKMRRGETLLRAGDPGNFMLAILAGEVRVVLPGAQGRDLTINTIGQGKVFGEIALFDGKPRSADVIAATNGRLLVIERAAVLRLMEADPRFAQRVLEIICGRLRNTLLQLDAMLFQDVATRLASTLLSLAQTGNPRRVDITQAELGQRVSASREIVNKRLRAWAKTGIVQLIPGRVLLLDEAALLTQVRKASF